MEKRKIVLDYKNILEYSQDSIEYLFVDKAEVVPGESAIGKKNCSMQDWFFRMHFPREPVMPGVLVMECLMSLGTMVLSTLPDKKGTRVLVESCCVPKFYRAVFPGDVLNLKVDCVRYAHGVGTFKGMADVSGTKVCDIDFKLIVPSDMLNMKKI